MSLLARLKDALGESNPNTRDPARARQIAAAVLLLAMAHADFEHAQVELLEIKNQLQSQFELSAAEADELMAQAQSKSQQSASLYPYLKVLNDGMGLEDKRQVLEMLWRVAYADQQLDPREENLMRELADLLYLPHREFIRAKLSVLEGE